MEDKDQVCFTLYGLNLTQLSIGTALKDLAAFIEQIDCLEPEASRSLRRHLSTFERNSGRSCEAIYSIFSSRQTPDALCPPLPASPRPVTSMSDRHDAR